jgi:hypothetical protein
MKSLFTILFSLFVFVTNAQRTLFGGQNNYQSPILSTSVVSSGLILNLDAGNTISYVGSGNNWNDLSGNNKNGFFSTETFSSSNGGSLYFPGNDFVSVPDLGSNPRFSIECWFKPTQTNSGIGQLVTSTFPGAGSLNFQLGYWGNNTMVGGFFDGGWRISPSVSVTLNTWQHLIVTYDGTNITLYSNGNVVGSTNYTGTPSSSGNGLRIGRRWDTGCCAEYFVGNIAVVRIFNRAISSTEVSNNFNALKTRFGL